MIYRVDLHVHTPKGSANPAACLPELVRAARRAGLDAVAITDEDYCTPVPAELRGVVLIPGCEVNTQGGKLLGVFLERPLDFVRLRARGLPTADEAVLEIHRCGGLAILTAPFAGGDGDPALFPLRPDAVETVCPGRAKKDSAAGQRALLWAAEHRRTRVGGSNACALSELGAAYTEFSCPRLTRACLKEALDLGRCRPVYVPGAVTAPARRPVRVKKKPARRAAGAAAKGAALVTLTRLAALLPPARKKDAKRPRKKK